MEIAFRVRNVEVPENLRRSTMAKVTRLGGRCGIDRADVCFSEERNPRIAEREVCEITLFGPGRILRAQAAATEAAVAAKRVVGQLEQRADRLRGRRAGGGHRRAWADSAAEGSVHCPTNWSAPASESGAVGHVAGDAGVAEPMTPEEAALEMGERGSDIFFFVNAETGRPAVVYHRRDGDIALVVT